MTPDRDLFIEGVTRLWQCFLMSCWAVFMGWLGGLAWNFSTRLSAPLRRPLAQVSLDELIGGGSLGFFFGALTGLLWILALVVLWRGMRKLWCDYEEIV
jgi:hypothetical protein